LVHAGTFGWKKENLSMKRCKFFWCVVGLAGSSLVAATAVVALGGDKPKPIADFTKRVRIERPAEAVVENQSGTVASSADTFVNPKVQPGRVQWHPTFAKACEAARKSGKPVLLFHMMGKLDEQFC
jgi:hypothetical protein